MNYEREKIVDYSTSNKKIIEIDCINIVMYLILNNDMLDEINITLICYPTYSRFCENCPQNMTYRSYSINSSSQVQYYINISSEKAKKIFVDPAD